MSEKTKEKAFVEKAIRHSDGHNLIAGARWHYPKAGSPTECAIKGCDRVLGQREEVEIEADDEDGPADAEDAA